ncbi:MAG: hypothetical protein US31_C0011G0036 [Berkelbacteria bacterium GW2011_GWA1_36_9]|uniref:DUF2283 domain-containing protein n=1 Tax=Berkelbacteria bacterium GW2011_GWA1_36_9 TaxID=1618331 RepID=A0A0G0I1A4_9BACT|nr:MAG: hypothetical protein US31_C0011G0036 [Berkelbacteria bacterium GW2011_GWA1_36_9]
MNSKNIQPKINYEPEADVLSYEITSQPIDYAKEVGNIVIHFTKNNMPVLVEILEATKFLKKAEKLTSKTGNLSVAGA